MTLTRTLNQTIFSQDGYRLVRCNVTFWNTTDANAIWVEIDNYKRAKVNVTVLNDTFWTDLPHYKILEQNNKQFQFSLNNTNEVILGHPYSFSIVLKIEQD